MNILNLSSYWILNGRNSSVRPGCTQCRENDHCTADLQFNEIGIKLEASYNQTKRATTISALA